MDALAAESATFPNGYVPTSLCRASLATILTGQYASQHKICCNDPPEGIDRDRMLPFMQNAPAVPRLLQEAGYRSLQTGKFWEGHYANAGFTDGMTTEGRHGGAGLAIGRETMQPIWDFLDDVGETPFFLWYAPMMPHRPHNPPDEYLERYAVDGRDANTAKYYAMCEWFDATVGTLLSRLEPLKDDTMVIFAVDNGWITLTEEEAEEQAGAFHARHGYGVRSKLSPYDMGLRTPLLMRWPGRIEPGLRRDLISTIDLAPTVLSAAGLAPMPAMPGVDLRSEDRRERNTLFGEIYTHDMQALERIGPSVTHQWVRHNDWKLIMPKEGDPPALYHLGRDPMEQNNLAPHRQDKVQSLAALLANWEYKSTEEQ